ncbi:MAG TPA: YceI family protein [Acidimicrobiales bacterium]|nr:YceI family protein [Acidimicrobiales bacterium]
MTMATPPDAPPDPEYPIARRRRRRWPWFVGGAVVLVLVGLVAGPFVYIHFIQADPKAKLTFENADKAAASTTTPTTAGGATTAGAPVGSATTAAAASTSATGVDGTWTATDASQLGYRVKEVLFGQSADAVGRTNRVEGQLTIAGTTVNAASFTVQVASITSDESRRDSQFTGRIMSTSQFPTATFTLTQPINFGSVPADKVEIDAQVTGDLTLRGVTKSVTFPITARRNGAHIEVSGSIPIVFADYRIPNPSTAGISTEDNGVMEFLLVFAHN